MNGEVKLKKQGKRIKRRRDVESTGVTNLGIMHIAMPLISGLYNFVRD